MKSFSIILTILLVGGALAFAQTGSDSKAAPTSKPATLTGVVSDTMCGGSHMMPGKSAAECTRECVKGGSDYALVVGKKVYTLKGNSADLDKYAGEKVTVKGAVSGSTITAESVNPAKTAKTSKKSGKKKA